MSAFARVAVNLPEIRDLFDYLISPEFEEKVEPGSLVEVPFGSQLVQAVVISLPTQPEVSELKTIDSLVDDFPVLTEKQLQLAFFLSQKYLQPLSAFIFAMLPPGLHRQADTLFKANLPLEFKISDLSSLSGRIVEKLRVRGPLRGRQLDAAFRHTDWRRAARALVRQGILISQPVLPEPSVRKKYSRSVVLGFPPSELENHLAAANLKASPANERRIAILRLLAGQSEPVDVSYVYASCGASSADLRWLQDRGWVGSSAEETWRDPMKATKPDLRFSVPPVLTASQAKVWCQIESLINEAKFSQPVLLHGVTASGKTELYMHAIAAALEKDRQAIVLVPEISLTPQTIERFSARFPGKVNVIHSRLSEGEHYDTWRRARMGDFPIIIGARSALFTPLPDVGVIIMDECHDASYYQTDFIPHFHAVEAAIAMGRQSKALVILGSATPDVSVCFRAQREGWPLLNLPERVSVSGAQPPEVKVVDMRAELRAGNTSMFSQALMDALSANLKDKQQSILLLNRRGSASYVFCRDCGFTLKCPRCDFALTWHSAESRLLCHTCGYTRSLPATCPQCGSRRIRQFGSGTESVSAELTRLFPNARILRWDADSVRGKGAEAAILAHFRQHNADILVGTQMLAKGLDLPLVTLVGVVLADVGLNFPDFRSAERAFQLLTQVAGRAGRGRLAGRVILQTFQPDHYAIRHAANQDFAAFYHEEVDYRRKLGYPPFKQVVRFECRSPENKVAQAAAEALYLRLDALVAARFGKAFDLSAPTPPYFAKRAGQYRWQVILKGTRLAELLDGEGFPGIHVEVDPPTLL